jgi:hypothetical protein
MQCGNGDTQDCEGSGGTDTIAWPSTQAQPGLLRLHDAGTHWPELNPSSGAYNWPVLDAWLDTIAQHQPLVVIQVFTWVPCWIPNTSPCTAPLTEPNGTSTPPGDLTASGSPSFNAFVTAFTQHCSPAGNCVSQYIKYYEMWNEWDLSYHWTGTMQQVYQMVAPAVSIIRTNVPSAVILTPSTTPDSDTGLGYQADFQNWLNYENANGKISDWIAWHVYLTDPNNTQTGTLTPENQWSNYITNYLSIQQSTSGWASVPWANTETNFNGSTQLNYQCPNGQNGTPAEYTVQDCTGQIVRWQILHDSNGSSSVDWYKWNETIGNNSQYEPAYYEMMKYMVGGKYTGAASSPDGGMTWTAPFTEANGTNALWVWTTNEGGVSYTVPAGYVDYRDLSGNMTTVTGSSSLSLTTEPFLLEQ